MARTQVFAAVAARRLEARRAGLRVGTSVAEFYHPAELPRQVIRSLGRADLLVIDVAAFFAASGPGALDLSAFPRWTRTLHDRIRHFRAATQLLLAAYPRGERWVQLVEAHTQALATGVLRPLVRRYPRASVDEYERILRDCVSYVQAAGIQLVLQGPGGFNCDEGSPSYLADTPKIYDEVNAMAKRVAEAAAIPIVDRISIGGAHPALFLGGTSRYSETGHRVMGEALADQLLTVSLV